MERMTENGIGIRKVKELEEENEKLEEENKKLKEELQEWLNAVGNK